MQEKVVICMEVALECRSVESSVILGALQEIVHADSAGECDYSVPFDISLLELHEEVPFVRDKSMIRAISALNKHKYIRVETPTKHGYVWVRKPNFNNPTQPFRFTLTEKGQEIAAGFERERAREE